MSVSVTIQGSAPRIEIILAGQVVETVRSTERLHKRARQEGWKIVESQSKTIDFAIQNPSTLAKEIRQEGESWSSALSRAGQLIRARK